MADRLEIIIEAADEASGVFRHVGESAEGMAGILGSIAKVGLVGLGAGIAGIAGAVKVGMDAASEWGEQIDRLGDQFGMTGGQASEWAAAMDHVGLSVDEGSQQLNYFTRMLGQLGPALAAGKVTPFGDALQKLGVSAFDTSGNLRSFDSLMPDIMDHFSKLPPGVEASELAMQLFGARGGTKFLDFLRQGSAGLKDAGELAKAFGLDISSGTSDAIEQFGFKMNDLGLAFEGLKVQIGLAVLPYLTQFVDYLTHTIAPKVIAFAQEVIPQIIGGFQQFVQWISPLTDALGTFLSVLLGSQDPILAISETLGKLFGSDIAAKAYLFFANLRDGLGALLKGDFAGALSHLQQAFGQIDWAGIGSMMLQALQQNWETVLFGPVGKIIVEKLGAALSSVDWSELKDRVLSGVGALAGLGLQFLQFIADQLNAVDWGRVVAVIGDGLGRAFSGAGSLLNALFNALGRVNWGSLAQHLGDLIGGAFGQSGGKGSGGFANKIFDAIGKQLGTIKWEDVWKEAGDIAGRIVTGLKDVLQGLGDLAGMIGGFITPRLQGVGKQIMDALSKDISSASSNLGTAISTAFSNAIGALQQKISSIFNPIGASVSGAVNALKLALQPLGDYIGGAFNSALSTMKGLWDGVQGLLSTINGLLKDAQGAWQDVLEKIQNILAPIQDVINNALKPLEDVLDHILGYVRDLVDWLGKMADALSHISLPDWAQRHSPSPIELTFGNTLEYVKGLVTVMPGLQFPAFASGGVGAGGGGARAAAAASGGMNLHIHFDGEVTVRDETDLEAIANTTFERFNRARRSANAHNYTLGFGDAS